MAADSLTFQDAVFRLQRFWADRGCLIWQPHNVEVGAGTMNPATFLQVLGPEPWNVAYFEPSIRPDDGRYGENPNRMGRHHQLQVILKPDPGDPQGLYLDSLAALGVELERHDIRFVEDNWEQPALGAWGLGWEVWLDGLEITQFTYFQQAGSIDLDPVSVEITYGLDRILMALQDVRHFKDLLWNDRLRGEDVQLQVEVQASKYFFEVAEVERLLQLYDLYEAEAQHAIESGLVYVAHDYLLKCSHSFNVLDTRGAVGVTERARYFGRMRRLARAVAEAYLAGRAALGFPILNEARPWLASTSPSRPAPYVGSPVAAVPADQAAVSPASPAAAPPTAHAAAAPPSIPAAPAPTAPADFLLEVGTEELPVADLDGALAALGAQVPNLLADLRLTHGPVSIMGTPRRMAVLVADLAPCQTDVTNHVVGPPTETAFDAAGRPTPAAEGFARSAGVAVDALTIVERGGQKRVAAMKRDPGRPTAAVLGEALPDLLAGLAFARTMRWNASGQGFSRPVRWLVALHGQAVVEMAFAGVQAGRASRGLRTAGSPWLRLAAAGDYRKLMLTHGIQVDPAGRRAEVMRQVGALATAAGGEVPDDPGLVGEVANLVEQPQAIVGRFEPEYLELPAPVLVTVLKKHQRYFPVLTAAGALQPSFIAVANGGGLDVGAVRHGNESVVRARFADAAYFWKRDTGRSLAEFTPALAKLTFQTDLGSMLDKVRRLERLVPDLADRLGLTAAERETARRAAALAKSDLATEMVVDFTSLQGIMGREYARLGGETEAVADAIYEQYLPRGAGDDLPASAPGTVLALADRLDGLVGLFAVGVKPSGTADPYGLRRAALGVTSILVGRDLSLDLAAAIDVTADTLPVAVGRDTKAEVLDFLRRRLEGQLRDAGRAADVVAAVLAVQGHDPAAAAAAVDVLARHIAQPGWQGTLDAYARCARIVRRQEEGRGEVDAGLFEAAAEHSLLAALTAATAALDPTDLGAVLGALAALAPDINAYFDAVLVMADHPPVRANRLALVRRIAALPESVADMSQLEGF